MASENAIAALFGCESPNEKMHANITVDLLIQHELLPPSMFDQMTDIIAATILQTDMLVSHLRLSAYIFSSSLSRTSAVVVK